MSTITPTMRHVRGFDVARPISIGMLIFMMLPLVFLPLASIFLFGTRTGLGNFWQALMQPEAIFALKLSMVTSFWATIFNVLFGLFAAYVLSRYTFWGRNALIVTISLPTAIPTAVAGFALLLLWGPYGTLGRLLQPHGFKLGSGFARRTRRRFHIAPNGLQRLQGPRGIRLFRLFFRLN